MATATLEKPAEVTKTLDAPKAAPKAKAVKAPKEIPAPVIYTVDGHIPKSQITPGKVPMEAVIQYREAHMDADVTPKGYTKGSTALAAFLKFYTTQCGDRIATPKAVHINTAERARLDEHAKWHLRKAIDRMNAAPKAAKTKAA